MESRGDSEPPGGIKGETQLKVELRVLFRIRDSLHACMARMASWTSLQKLTKTTDRQSLSAAIRPQCASKQASERASGGLGWGWLAVVVHGSAEAGRSTGGAVGWELGAWWRSEGEGVVGVRGKCGRTTVGRKGSAAKGPRWAGMTKAGPPRRLVQGVPSVRSTGLPPRLVVVGLRPLRRVRRPRTQASEATCRS